MDTDFFSLFNVDKNEYSMYREIIENLKCIQFFLFPNLETIHQVGYIDEDFIFRNKEYFKLCIVPVYKHFWKYSYLKKVIVSQRNYIYLNYEITEGTFFSIPQNDINIIYHNIPDNQLSIRIGDDRYIFSYEAYSYLSIKRKVVFDDLTFYQVFGTVKAAIRFGFLSTGIEKKGDITFRQKLVNPLDSDIKYFQKISLKSLEPINQIRFFDIWVNRKDCVITGSTGVGKTSQVPKVFFWYNFLFGGYDFNLSSVDLDNFNKKDKTMIIFPRKALIVSNGENFLRSLGYRTESNIIIENSPVTMNFKNVSNTIYYNKNPQSVELNFCINRIAASIKLNDDRLASVFVDEIHEHETFSDICITILRNQRKRYNNIILMSATIDEDKDRIYKYFNKNIEFIHIEGDKLHPVKEIIIGDRYVIEDVITKHRPDKGKAGIFFFSRISDISSAFKHLSSVFENDKNLVFIPIHSKVYPSASDIIKKIESSHNKSVIALSTNILESSLTLCNAQYVYDTGTFFSKRFFGGEVDNITYGMAEQRKGRVGRKLPGNYIVLYDKNKLKKDFKKINYEFLYPYVIFLKMYKIKFDDIFIIPDDATRFERTIEYLRQNDIFVDNRKFMKHIYRIYNTYPCDMIEYISIYLKNSINKMLENFENIDSNEKKIEYVMSNNVLYKNLTSINFVCKLKKIKQPNKNDKLISISVEVLNQLVDGCDIIYGQTMTSKTYIKIII